MEGRGGAEGDYYTCRCCHHRNDSCIKMGSDGSHFNVSLTVRDKVPRQCPQTTICEEKEERKRIRTEVPLLTSIGQSSSLSSFIFYFRKMDMT